MLKLHICMSYAVGIKSNLYSNTDLSAQYVKMI